MPYSKTTIIISIVSLLTAFAAGRYSVQQPTIKLTSDTKTSTTQDQEKQEHKKITIVKIPNGTTTTTITDDTTTNTQEQQQETSHVTETITPPKTNTLSINALAATSIHAPGTMIYGASIQKQFLGPINTGLFGLTNGTVGVTIGLSF
jgi:hypothetical protein